MYFQGGRTDERARFYAGRADGRHGRGGDSDPGGCTAAEPDATGPAAPGGGAELASGIRSARVAAITRHQAVSIQAIDEDWSQGWRIVVEQKGIAPNDALLVERMLSGQVRIVGNSKVAQKLSFGGLGGLLGAGNGTLFVCLNDRPASHYQVVVAVTGQVRVIEQQASQAYCG